jgi:hypothetical protein
MTQRKQYDVELAHYDILARTYATDAFQFAGCSKILDINPWETDDWKADLKVKFADADADVWYRFEVEIKESSIDWTLEKCKNYYCPFPRATVQVLGRKIDFSYEVSKKGTQQHPPDYFILFNKEGTLGAWIAYKDAANASWRYAKCKGKAKENIERLYEVPRDKVLWLKKENNVWEYGKDKNRDDNQKIKWRKFKLQKEAHNV